MYIFKYSRRFFEGEMFGQRAGTKQRTPLEGATLDFWGKEFRAVLSQVGL
jgi:hypothetical protein